MAPHHVQGTPSQRAGADPSSTTTGSQPRLDAATRARSKEIAAQFAAQVELTMLQSLQALGSDESGQAADAGDGMDGGGEQDVGLGDDLLQQQLVAALHSGLAKHGLGTAQIQAQLAAIGLATGAGGAAGSEGVAGAGAGTEAARAQQLLGTLAAPEVPQRDARANARLVAQVAREQGVDPTVAVAMMLVESGGDNRAVGDGGTSFGLFQLHHGGMLTAAGLTPNQAFDPRTNATVALRSFAHEHAKGHARRSPGEIAAASQRPADPAGYAAKVDAAMDRARALLA